MQAWDQAGVPLWDLTLEKLPARRETLVSSQILPFFSTARVFFLSIANGDMDDYLRLLSTTARVGGLHVTTLMRRPTFCDPTIMSFLPQLKILELQCDVPESYDTRTLRYIRCVVAAYSEHKRLHSLLGSLVIAPSEHYRFSHAVFRVLSDHTDLSWTLKTGKLIGTRVTKSHCDSLNVLS
ncbi:hypothetical protein BDN71DRAFT_1156172 [Pleurotus eryngii]|uniref:Uncharacterized protein n=1 Tax=Pleurotus eryngii TaxID=5323 RepID=A0A9P5ZSU5_PLEER|nr:hypothetical protein BDN71DRAFT_1156172 [Pleurotus eryngii]